MEGFKVYTFETASLFLLDRFYKIDYIYRVKSGLYAEQIFIFLFFFEGVREGEFQGSKIDSLPAICQ